MFRVDNTFLWDNCFYIESELGTKYCVRLNETAPGTNIWIINFILISGTPKGREVFKTLSILWENLKKFFIDKDITSAFGYIDGKTREERDQKTKIFTRWVDYPFEVIVDASPEIRIQGSSRSHTIDTNMFHISRIPKSGTDKEELKLKEEIQKIDTPTNTEIKFCFNCGNPNNSFVFCPNCGTKLKQA